MGKISSQCGHPKPPRRCKVYFLPIPEHSLSPMVGENSHQMHRLLNKRTSEYGWVIRTGWLERILNILQISHHISIKLSVCTSTKVIVLWSWSILKLAMPKVKTEPIQNLALFWDCWKKPKSAMSGNLSKNAYVNSK